MYQGGLLSGVFVPGDLLLEGFLNGGVYRIGKYIVGFMVFFCGFFFTRGVYVREIYVQEVFVLESLKISVSLIQSQMRSIFSFGNTAVEVDYSLSFLRR